MYPVVRELEVGRAVYADREIQEGQKSCRESLQCQAVPCCVAGSQRRQAVQESGLYYGFLV